MLRRFGPLPGVSAIDPSSLSNVAHRWWAGNFNEGGAAPSNGAPCCDPSNITWKDLISTSDSTVFGLATVYPTFRSADSNMGNQPTVEFDGVNDFAYMAYTLTTPAEWLFVLRLRSIAGSSLEFIMDTRNIADSQAVYFYRDNDAAENDWAMGDLAANQQGGTVDTSTHCVRVVSDGTSRSVTVDGSVVASGTSPVGDRQLDDMVLGSVQGAGFYAPVSISDVTVIDGRITSDEWNGYRQWAYEQGYGTPAP